MSVSRVIEVSFGGGSIAYAKVDTAYFYNNGILFKPTDIELPTSYQVHWADSPQASSTLETIGTAEGAPIPDDLWNRSRVIYGWIYLHPTEDSGVTGYEVRIYKNVRAGLPDGTEPTPAEQSTIDQLISALNSAVEQTGEDVESAEQAKDDAESARDNAQTYANNAQESAQASARSAESASQSASQASQSATASANSASASAQIRADVEGMVDDAQGYAQASAQSASASANSATQAQGYANSASTSAQSASTSASDALTYANTASTKASEASTSAQTASQKATEASQSAENALSYKTDAESAKTASQTAQGLAESARDTAVSAKTDAESARDDAESARDEAQSAVASIGNALAEKAPVITDTASGAIASFSDGADDLPIKSLLVDIDPVQDLSHDDPSPENICPISGWDAVGVTRTGKNLLSSNFNDYSQTNAYRYILNVVPQNTLARFTFADKDTTIDVRGCYIGFCWEAPAPNASINEYRWCVNNGSIQANTSNRTGRGVLCGNVFIYPNTKDVFDRLFARWNIMVELGSTATPYEPYTGRSITISLGQTVYGGKLDVLSGKLTVDMAMVDLGTLNWITPSDNRFYTTSLSSVIKKGTDGALWIQSSMFRTTSALSVVYNSLDAMWLSASGNISISKIADTAAALKTAVTGQQLVYKLATPIEIQLSENQLNSLYGVNNIWADSGDTEVEYRADTKLYIERLTAPDSADMVADANITSGQYFMVGNSLYKATANIANGAQIIVGTNCIRKSLSEALNEINA